jgi:hypothetical protein
MNKKISQGFSKGPVEILCGEIGAVFNSNMETIPVFMSFMARLVAEIEHDEIMSAKIRGSEVDEKLQQAFVDIDELLSATSHEQISYLADQFCIHESPKHLLRGCALAIKFGLEAPCKSRHAADVAKQICRHLYGYSMHDTMINEFENQWVRNKFYDSLGRLAGEVRLENYSA